MTPEEEVVAAMLDIRLACNHCLEKAGWRGPLPVTVYRYTRSMGYPDWYRYTCTVCGGYQDINKDPFYLARSALVYGG